MKASQENGIRLLFPTMNPDDIQEAIELCLSSAAALDPARPERDALVYEVVQLRQMAEMLSTGKAEPIRSNVIASTRDGLSFDDEVLAVLGRTFRKYDLWCRRSEGDG